MPSDPSYVSPSGGIIREKLGTFRPSVDGMEKRIETMNFSYSDGGFLGPKFKMSISKGYVVLSFLGNSWTPSMDETILFQPKSGELEVAGMIRQAIRPEMKIKTSYLLIVNGGADPSVEVYLILS